MRYQVAGPGMEKIQFGFHSGNQLPPYLGMQPDNPVDLQMAALVRYAGHAAVNCDVLGEACFADMPCIAVAGV